MKENIHVYKQQLRPSDDSLWRTKSRTSSQYITMIQTPKERSDLVLHFLLKNFFEIRPK